MVCNYACSDYALDAEGVLTFTVRLLRLGRRIIRFMRSCGAGAARRLRAGLPTGTQNGMAKRALRMAAAAGGYVSEDEHAVSQPTDGHRA